MPGNSPFCYRSSCCRKLLMNYCHSTEVFLKPSFTLAQGCGRGRYRAIWVCAGMSPFHKLSRRVVVCFLTISGFLDRRPAEIGRRLDKRLNHECSIWEGLCAGRGANARAWFCKLRVKCWESTFPLSFSLQLRPHDPYLLVLVAIAFLHSIIPVNYYFYLLLSLNISAML